MAWLGASFALFVLLALGLTLLLNALDDREAELIRFHDAQMELDALGPAHIEFMATVERSITRLARGGAWIAGAGLLTLYLGLVGGSMAVWRVVRRQKSELNRTRELLGSVVEHSNDAILTASLDGSITSWNAAAEQLFGYRASEIIGRHRSFIVPVSRAYESLAAALAFRFGHVIQNRDTIRLHHDGREIPVLITSSPIREEDGKVVGTSAIIRDNSVARHEDERRATFISVASHGLRTPLTSVLGFSELLLERTPPEDVRNKWVSAIHTEAARMHAIISELLDLSTIQSGHMDLEIGPVRVGEVIDEVAATMRPAMVGRLLVVACAAELPGVAADKDKIVRVVTNLVDNAIKYSPGRLPVIISAEMDAEGQGVRVSVIDHGVGIEEVDLSDLFGSFHRIRNDITRDVGGAGLGLHITKTLVEAMGGAIAVDSQPGRGSKFMVTFPVAEQTPAPAQPGGAPRELA